MTQIASSLSLNVYVSRELENDVLSIYFQAAEAGADAATVQEALRKRLNDAVAVVKPLAKEGEVEIETSGFSVQPTYEKKNTKIAGYRGATSLTVKGTDTATISKLASEITSMTISGTDNSLSKKARKAVEKELTAEAIATYREKATDAATAFGAGAWRVGAISIAVDRDYGGRRGAAPMAMMASASLESAGGIDVEGGKTEAGVTVTGTVLLGEGSAPPASPY